jgi:hypothetical protein
LLALFAIGVGHPTSVEHSVALVMLVSVLGGAGAFAVLGVGESADEAFVPEFSGFLVVSEAVGGEGYALPMM